MGIVCRVCTQENPEGQVICQRCGAELPRPPARRPRRLELQLQGQENVIFRIEPPVHEGYIIGRTDDTSDYIPDVDLASHGGRDQGISRRHAALVFYHGVTHLVDLNSVNGTFVNGIRLTPETAYELLHGDTIRLGNMSLRVAHIN